jgi:hypothetical protein
MKNQIKTIDLSNGSNTRAEWAIDQYGDIAEWSDREELQGELRIKVITASFYPGSEEEWRVWILDQVA